MFGFNLKNINLIKLGEVAGVYSGYAFKSSDLCDNGIPVIKIANIQNKGVNRDCAQKFPKTKITTKLDKYFLQKNDVLVAMTGQGSLGRIGKMNTLNGSYLINQRVGIVRSKSDDIIPGYLYSVLSQDVYEKKLRALGLGAGQPNVSGTDISNLKIPFPDKESRKFIADTHQTYNDLIENNNHRIAILEEMAQKLYREWFVKFRFPGHEDVKMVSSEPGEIPEEWEVVKIADIYKTSSGGTPSRKKPEYYDNGHIPWVKTKELKDCFVIESEEKITNLGLKGSSAKLFPKHSVLLAMYGATIGKLGIISQEASSNQACCALIVKEESFSPWYAYLYLYINRNHIIGQRIGAAQQNISQQIIKDFSILKPSKQIMKIFNEIIEPMFLQIETLQKKNKNLKQQRDLLLPKLISGKIDV